MLIKSILKLLTWSVAFYYFFVFQLVQNSSQTKKTLGTPERKIDRGEESKREIKKCKKNFNRVK